MQHPTEFTKVQRRKTLLMLASTLTLGACASGRKTAVRELSPEEQRLAQKFKGIHGVITRIDADSIKECVWITNQRGNCIDGSGMLSPWNVASSAYGGGFPIPVTVRATWRTVKPGEPVYSNNSGWLSGTVIGDYTVPVAERIPEEVLDYIRKNGGALRLKIRLHDEGIYIGWDVEVDVNDHFEYRMAGGDFCEPKIIGGKIIRHAWYIDKKGQKIFTDENPHAANLDPRRRPQPINEVHE